MTGKTPLVFSALCLCLLGLDTYALASSNNTSATLPIVQPQTNFTNPTDLGKEEIQKDASVVGKRNGTANLEAENIPRLRKIISTDNTALMAATKSNSTTKTSTNLPPSALNVTSPTTTTTAKTVVEKMVADGVALNETGNNKKSTTTLTLPSDSKNSSSTTNTTTTSSTSSTTTTSTTTTTPLPPKPKIAYNTDVHPEWEAGKAVPSSTVPPVLPVAEQPQMQPSQEFSSSNNLTLNHSNEYVVPILAVLLTVPLVIVVVVVMYRRFRDLWSTRHYRRMDFLVDGMYND